jgi:hypothetical protein
MRSASRTLVMSPPELWELIDQPERMQGLMSGLLGRATEVTVNEREPESVLRWEASDDGADAWIEVELAEKGWGTNVKVKAENGGEPTKLEGWLDAVLEELATPQKRPFEGMGNEPMEKPPAEQPAAEVPSAGKPAVVAATEPPSKDPQPEEPSKRRLFGLL